MEKEFDYDLYNNWFNVFSLISRLKAKIDIELFQKDSITYVSSKEIPIPLTNGIIEYKEDKINREKVEEVNNFFDSKKIPYAWNITPNISPIELEEYLQNLGFQTTETVPHMAYEHKENDVELFKEELTKSNLKIKEVTHKTINTFSKTMNEGFGLPKIIQKPFHKMNAEFLSEKDKFKFILGYVDNKPVSTALAFFDSNVVGIYNVSTKPEYRKRGFGRLMTLDLILQGNELGLKRSILQSSKMGKAVYEKIGFKTIYEQKKMMKIEKKN